MRSRSRRRFTIIAVSVLLLGAGVVLGFLPVRATLTQVTPELRLVGVACGNGYLQATPPVQPGDLVALPDEPGVYLPRTTYAEHCGQAAGWRRYAAWALTALGALGLAITFSTARPPVDPEPLDGDGSPGHPGPAPRSRFETDVDLDPDPSLGSSVGRSVGSIGGAASDVGDREGDREDDGARDGASSGLSDPRPGRRESQAGASRGRHARRDES